MKHTFRALGATALALAALFAAVAPARAQTASATASTPALAQYAPQNEVILYLEFDGLAAHDKAWHESAASKVLSDTKTGAMFEEILTQLFEQMLAQVPDRALNGAEVTTLAKHALQYGFVISLNGKPSTGTPPSGTVVVRNVMTAECKPLTAKLLRTARLVHQQAAITDKPGGRRVANPGPGAPNWWLEKNSDLVLTEAGNVDKVIAAIDGKAPSMITHPRRDKLSKGQEGFEPVGWGFAEMSAFGPLPPDAAKMGLDGVKSVQVQWGLDGPAMRSVLDIEAPAPRRGALSLFDQPTFDVSSVPPLPDKIEAFAVFSVDFNQSLMKLSSVLDQAGIAGVKGQINDMEESFRKSTKLDLRKDVLAQLGPKMTIYTLPAKTGVAAALNTLNPLGMLNQIPRTVVKIEIKDQVAVTKSLTQLMTFANKQIATMMPPADASAAAASTGTPGRSGARTKTTKPQALAEFKMLKPKPVTYQLVLAPQFALVFSQKVTITLSAKNLIIATEPGLASDALALDEKESTNWTPQGDFATAVKNMPKSLVFFGVTDIRDTTPKAIAELPATLQRALTALVPSQQASPAGGLAAAGAPGGNPNAGATAAIEPGIAGRGGRGSGRGPVGAPAPEGGGGGRSPVGAPPPGGGQAPVGAPPPGGGNAPGLPSAGAGGAPGTTSAGAPGLPPMTINVPPDKIPTAESVRSLLFPSAMAVSVDAQGMHIVSREAFFDIQSLAAGLNSLAMSRAQQQAAMSAGQMAGGPGAGQPGAGNFPGAPGAGAAGGARGGGGGTSASRPD